MGHIQIRNVPEDVHRTLKARSATKGMSLSDYLLEEVVHLAELPTPEELVERVRRRGSADPGETAADAIRRLRGPI